MKGIVEVSITLSFYLDEDLGYTNIEEVKSYGKDVALELMIDKFIAEYAEVKFHEEEGTDEYN